MMHVHDLGACANRIARGATLLVSALALSATAAAAQLRVTTSYATGCGAGTGCGQIWFTITNTSASDISLNTLMLHRTTSSYAFSPQGGVGTFDGQDDLGPLAGFTTVSSNGSQLFIDFINTGDPMNPGFPFTVFANGSGELETTIDPTTLPQNAGTIQFAYSAAATDGTQIAGIGNPVAMTTPEPSTDALLIAGLLPGAVAHRIRRKKATRSSASSAM